MLELGAVLGPLVENVEAKVDDPPRGVCADENIVAVANHVGRSGRSTRRLSPRMRSLHRVVVSAPASSAALPSLPSTLSSRTDSLPIGTVGQQKARVNKSAQSLQSVPPRDRSEPRRAQTPVQLNTLCPARPANPPLPQADPAKVEVAETVPLRKPQQKTSAIAEVSCELPDRNALKILISHPGARLSCAPNCELGNTGTPPVFETGRSAAGDNSN